MKFSFVVAAYNVESYIEACVNSIVHSMAGCHEFEILAVDDGSTDGTGAILDGLAEKNSCVHVLHQANAGLSAVRNTGLDAVEGDYVFFVDGDDYFEERGMPELYDFIAECGSDMILFPADAVADGVQAPFFQIGKHMVNVSAEEAFQRMLEEDYTFGWVVWHYAFKTEFLREKGILFPRGRICEDVEFTFRAYMGAKTCSTFVEYPVYIYRRDNGGSLSHIASFKFVDDLSFNMTQNLPAIDTIQNQKLRNLLYLNYQSLAAVLLSLLTNYSREQRKVITDRLRGIKRIYRTDAEYRSTYRVVEKIIKILVAIFGFDVVGWMYMVWRKLNGRYAE